MFTQQLSLPHLDDAAGFAQVLSATVEVLRNNNVAAVPTETVYGLAGRAHNDDAVRAIFAAKNRPADNPLILHVHDIEAADALFVHDSTSTARAHVLMEAFWPGPLTIVALASTRVSQLVRAGLPKVAVRVPQHAFARALAQALGEPFAAPSANVSGRPSPTTAAHVLATMNGRIPLVVDGGPCLRGVESTVVDISASRPVVLRLGALSIEAIAAVVPDVTVLGAHEIGASPGLRHRHYRPHVTTFTLVSNVDSDAADQLAQAWMDEHSALAVFLGLHALLLRRYGPPRAQIAQLPADAVACAYGLYATLYALESTTTRALYVQRPPATAAWATVNDRLQRASA